MKCRFEHEGICANCGAKQYRNKCQKPCDEIRPMTNAQAFRQQVSTEEGLVTFLMKAHDGEINIPFCRSDVVCKGEDDPMGEGCRECMMQWLRKPYEGDCV
jgi:hypothetical protein